MLNFWLVHVKVHDLGMLCVTCVCLAPTFDDDDVTHMNDDHSCDDH